MSGQADQFNKAAASRRRFIKTSSAWLAGGVVGSGFPIPRAVHARGGDSIQIGLIGCERDAAAVARDVLATPEADVRLTALADFFADRLQGAYRALRSRHAAQVEANQDRRFIGPSAHEQLLQSEVDLVILSGPPAFRPALFEAAVQAGKHALLQWPLAVDAQGVRQLAAANELAKRRGLIAAVWPLRRHEAKYQDTIARLQEGAIGRLQLLRAYWNGNSPSVKTSVGRPSWENQLRDWRASPWLSGDLLVDRLASSLDVSNWLLRETPRSAAGLADWPPRTFDGATEVSRHQAVELTYASGVYQFIQCRLANNCWNNVSEHAHGTDGSADISAGKIHGPDRRLRWRFEPGKPNRATAAPGRRALDALREGVALNDLDAVLPSAMTAVLARDAAHLGGMLRLDDVARSNRDLRGFTAHFAS